MFGSITFMIAGSMATGVIGDDLMVRLNPSDAEQALNEPHVRPMPFTGKPMKGMIYVASAGTEADEDLAGWVEAGAESAASLPPSNAAAPDIAGNPGAAAALRVGADAAQGR